jgi:putative hydrolase of the HAD superfamily
MDTSSPRFRAVLFDFFGTLTQAVQRGPAHIEFAQRMGCDPAAYFRVLDKTFYARASGGFGTPAGTLHRVLRMAGAAPTPEQVAWAVQARIGVARADVRMRREALPVLGLLRHWGVRTAVVSDCWYELPRFFPRLPIARLVDATVFSVEVGHCKPHPAMYLTACEQLGVEPAECLFIGDGGSHELSGARCVGMLPVQLDTPDLAEHLVFHSEVGWKGLRVGSLANIVPLVTARPAVPRRTLRAWASG